MVLTEAGARMVILWVVTKDFEKLGASRFSPSRWSWACFVCSNWSAVRLNGYWIPPVGRGFSSNALIKSTFAQPRHIIVASPPMALNIWEVKIEKLLDNGTSFPQWATGMHTSSFPSQKLLRKFCILDSTETSFEYFPSGASSDATCFIIRKHQWWNIPYNRTYQSHICNFESTPTNVINLVNTRSIWPFFTSRPNFSSIIPKGRTRHYYFNITVSTFIE